VTFTPIPVRCDDLSLATLHRARPIALVEFTPPPLARRFEERFRKRLEDGTAMGAVLDADVEGRTCVAAAAWTFIKDEVHERLQDIPLTSIDEWLVDEVLPGTGVLGREEIARANAGAGLHLLMLYFKGEDAALSEDGRLRLVHEMRAHIFPNFLGYNLRSLTARVRHLSQVDSAVQSGCRIMRDERVPAPLHGEFLPHPVLLHVERNWVHFGSWIAGVFAWQPPIFEFSAAEQRLLALAMRGHRDETIASLCAVGPSTIKKRWDSILARAAGAAPDLFDGDASSPPGRRGREKRTRLLTYLGTHLEELRPYSR
jgi:hypothetical protein